MRELDIKQQELELKKAEAVQGAEMDNFDKQIKLRELQLEEARLANEAAAREFDIMSNAVQPTV
jgi:hypothetical protein